MRKKTGLKEPLLSTPFLYHDCYRNHGKFMPIRACIMSVNIIPQKQPVKAALLHLCIPETPAPVF